MTPGDLDRLVIRAPNPLGDAIMSLPAMAAVRGALGHRTLIVAAAPSVAPLFQELTAVAPDRVVVVDKRTESSRLRELEAGAIVLFTNSFRTAWASRRAAIRERWGYRTHARSMLLTRPIRRPRQRVHQSEYYLHLVRELGLVVDPHRGLKIPVQQGPAPQRPEEASEASSTLVAPASSDPGDPVTIRITPETRRRVDTLLRLHAVDPSTPLVGFAPGAAYGHAKRWPPERVAQVVARLGARGATCVLVGAGGDREAGRDIEAAIPRGWRVINLIGRTDLRLLAGLLAVCDAFVSNDSGAMHLAAAVGTRVIAIFGPTDERVTAPLGHHDVILHQVFCRPCMLRDCPIDHRCMRRIDVDTVFEAVVRRLDAKK